MQRESLARDEHASRARTMQHTTGKEENAGATRRDTKGVQHHDNNLKQKANDKRLPPAESVRHDTDNRA
jgi:hypothetical protein